jgi:Cu/Ag efflux protein CusF
MRPSPIDRTFLALAAAAMLASPAAAAPEKTKGNILTVDFSAMKIVVKHPQGYNMTLSVSPSTPVRFTDGTEFFINPTVRDLASGMYIYFTHERGVVEDIDVREIPNELRRPRASQPGGSSDDRPERLPGGGSRTIKARLMSIDERRGEFRADVAGRNETFRVDQPRELRRFQQGDLVVLTVEGRGRDEVVTEIRTAGQSGRVTRVDRRRGQVWIDAGDREESYRVDDKKLLEGIRKGERVRFEFEDRSLGRKVITAIY